MFGACHPEVFALGTDKSDFAGPDTVIDAGAGVALRGRVVGSAGYWIRSFCFMRLCRK